MLTLLILAIVVFWLIGEFLGAVGIFIALAIGGGSLAFYYLAKPLGLVMRGADAVAVATTITAVIAGIYVWSEVDLILGVIVALVIMTVGGSVMNVLK